MGITPRDVILMYLPLFHVFGLYEGLLMSVATGARMVLTTVFDPEEVLRLRSIKRTRNCLATREGGKVAANVTA
jgi:acyl-CoA synthetase (AMP-forming)/AMP-acid ligase II